MMRSTITLAAMMPETSRSTIGQEQSAMEHAASELADLLTPPGAADLHPQVPDFYATTPPRITVHKKVKVIPSQILNAGRGLMACEEAEPDQLICETDGPMFKVVEDGKYMTSHCCDNCLATVEEGTEFQTVSRHLTFSTCGRCRVVYYCGKICQGLAWNSHHRFECKCLKKLSQLTLPRDAQGKEVQSEDMPAVYQAVYRLIIRVLCMTQVHFLPQSLLTEMAGIYTPDPDGLTDDELAGVWRAATLLNQITGLFDKVEEMVDIWHLVSSNYFSMSLPLLRHWGRGYKYNSGPTVKAVRYLDPFFSLINHSCDPNTALSFEESNIRLVATREIAVGEEITIAYIPYTHYKVRKLEFEKRWNFTCACSVCERCKQSMHGPAAYFDRTLFRNPIDPQGLLSRTRGHGDQKIDDEVTQIMRWHLRIHHKNMFLRHCKNGDRRAALKSAVVMNAIGSDLWPKISADESQDAMYHLIHQLRDQDIEIDGAILDSLCMHLRTALNNRLALRYGDDKTSMFVLCQRTQFAHCISAWEKKYNKTWIPAQEGYPCITVMFNNHLDMLWEWAMTTRSPIIVFTTHHSGPYRVIG